MISVSVFPFLPESSPSYMRVVTSLYLSGPFISLSHVVVLGWVAWARVWEGGMVLWLCVL